MCLLYTIINTSCVDTKNLQKLQLYRIYCLLSDFQMNSKTSFVCIYCLLSD